ncbi:MAG: hypothetical protein WAP03_19360 [Methylorubrum rhodinum]|uniref:hypothetical protein n=1 Tax=Methylorubrum rhodinum TaxID=29428 RepID=UPI003BB204C2
MLTKLCSKCEEIKPVAEFNRDRTRVDGRYSSCKECSRATCRKTYRAHHDTHVELKRRWKAENAERHREINREYRQANPDKVRAGTARYRARLARATPPWVDPKALKLFQSACPLGWHTDHIRPLAGKNFCGLNVPWNWQHLPADQHWKKGTQLLADAGGCYNL